MMVRRLLAGGMTLCLLVAGSPAFAQSEMQPAQPQARSDVVAVVSPLVRVRGRVLEKDGVTPVYSAALVLSSKLDGSQRRVVSDEDGLFDIRLPVGQYNLRISRLKEIFESPSVYSIPLLKHLDVDFLLLRHFEPEPVTDDRSGASASRFLPDPKSQPEVVGTIIDVVRQSTAAGGKRRRWGEVFGFVGGLVLVGIAAS